jgi:hypothetical protein
VDRSLPATFVSVATRIVTPAKYMEPEKRKVRGESGSPKIKATSCNHTQTDVQDMRLRVPHRYNMRYITTATNRRICTSGNFFLTEKYSPENFKFPQENRSNYILV